MSSGGHIALLGAGLMGQGIAAAFLHAGFNVIVWDVEENIAPSMEKIRFRLAAMPPTGRPAGRLTGSPDLHAVVAGAKYVLECLPEDADVKRSVLAAADDIADRSAVFLTNTSSIPLATLAKALADSRPLIAVHFFNPAEIVPGVEVAAHRDADASTAESVFDLLSAIGKTPVLVSPTPAYIGNRLQAALFREALLCLEEGIATPVEVDEIVKSTFGFRLANYGPFEIADMAGLNVFAAILANLEQTYGSRFSTPASLTEMLTGGRTGVFTGGGFYEYDEDAVETMNARRDAAYRAVLESRL